MTTEIFLRNLQKAFNSPNSMSDYLTLLFIVLVIAGICILHSELGRRKKPKDED